MSQLSDLIKEKRKELHYSQQELANATGLSLRTIQRIEKGETNPQGHTLKAIFAELLIDPNSLSTNHNLGNQNKTIILHLMTIIGFIIPLGNILAPLFYWLYQKNDKDKMFNQQAKNLLFWQGLVTPIAFLVFLITTLGKLAHIEILNINPQTGLGIYFFIKLFFFLSVPMLIALLTAKKGIKNYYPPVFKR